MLEASCLEFQLNEIRQNAFKNLPDNILILCKQIKMTTTREDNDLITKPLFKLGGFEVCELCPPAVESPPPQEPTKPRVRIGVTALRRSRGSGFSERNR